MQITLEPSQLQRLLGITIPKKTVETILDHLALPYETASPRLSTGTAAPGWCVHIPSYRFDLRIAEDLVEEVARLYGYDKIPTQLGLARLQIRSQPEDKVKLSSFKHALCSLGYHEVITYSFVDKKMQDLLDPGHPPKMLLNPITAEMSVMRTSLWSGLIGVLLNNKNRQQDRVRIFESGLCFIPHTEGLLQQNKLGGVVSGSAYPQQWGLPARDVDFFDLKGDLQNLLQLTLAQDEFNFQVIQHPALHPGQAAAIYRGGEKVGIVGVLHPFVLQTLDISSIIYVFEFNLDKLELAKVPRYHEISKYPEIRRDISVVLEQAVPAQVIQDTIREIAHEWLKEMTIFDVYQGKGVAAGFKSIALSFVLQHPGRTLVEEEVATWMDKVIQILRVKLGAELRS